MKQGQDQVDQKRREFFDQMRQSDDTKQSGCRDRDRSSGIATAETQVAPNDRVLTRSRLAVVGDGFA